MPKPRSVDDVDVIAALAGVFRRDGFDGASLASLAEATGLKRASLYHRFPGGKADMARAVLRAVHATVRDEVLAPLRADGELRARLEQVARRLDDFYRGGRQACLLETLSVGRPEGGVADELRASFSDLVEGLASAAREAGAADDEARRRATDAVVAVEGALVVSRVTGETSAFDRVLEGLPDLIVGG